MEIIKEKKVAIPGNSQFELYRLAIILIIILSCGFSIVDKINVIIEWPERYEDIVAISVQVIVTVISLIASIIGIAISLQNEKFFGVKITQLYALRIASHYSILGIILISVFLCALNLVFIC